MLQRREALSLDFDADEFWKLSLQERREICIQFAERAQALAMSAPEVPRLILMNIAAEWLHLLDVINGEESRHRH